MRLNTLEKVVRPAPAAGLNYDVIDLPVAASQTIKKGDFVILSGSAVTQAIALPGSDSTVGASGGNLAIVGIAEADITTSGSVNEATDRVPVAIWNENLRVSMKIFNSTAGDAEPQDLTRGTAYQLGRYRGASASVWFYVVTTTTTNGECVFQQRQSANDENYGLCQFKPAFSATIRVMD